MWAPIFDDEASRWWHELMSDIAVISEEADWWIFGSGLWSSTKANGS